MATDTGFAKKISELGSSIRPLTDGVFGRRGKANAGERTPGHQLLAGLARAWRLATAPWRQLLGLLPLGWVQSSVTRWIVAVNFVGLVALLIGITAFSRHQAWWIQAKRESLLTQGEIIAAAIAGNAVVRPEGISFSPGQVPSIIGDESNPHGPGLEALQFSIRADKVAPIFRKLVQPTNTRARIYNRDGTFILDSAQLFSRSRIRRSTLPPLKDAGTSPWSQLRSWFRRNFWKSDLPIFHDLGRKNGKNYLDVSSALAGGVSTATVMVNPQGQKIVSVAVPIQRFKAIQGALLLSTRGGELDDLLEAEFRSLLVLLGVTGLIVTILSLVLARGIAVPLRDLSSAAERVRRSIRLRQQLPDYSYRADEIGDLSRTLREMTNSLYRRVEASDRFAADVAHELKNPLAGLRGMSESLLIVTSDEDRALFVKSMKSDIERLTTLIDDIASASRLESEFALTETQPIDMTALLETMVTIFNDVHVRDDQRVVLNVEPTPLASDAYVIDGLDTRLGQVFTNLLDNALSFSPADGIVSVSMARKDERIVIHVDDQGPGIPEDKLEKIFSRFYSDRPGQAEKRKNSGLGLSISREIAQAHGGNLVAENTASGARFIVTLPAALPAPTSSARKRRAGG